MTRHNFFRETFFLWPIAAFWLLSLSAHADDLGVVGPTYKIIERDLLEVIVSKLKKMQLSGSLKQYEEDYKKKIISSIEHPKPLTGFRATQTPRTHYYDPTYVLQMDIVDASGNILYPKGTKINPLDHVSMNTYLLFVDGRDEKQLAFSRKVANSADRPVKIVLVAGEPLTLMRKWKSPVYFDQGGVLIKRFSITQVPAIVRQEGKRLRIDELRY